MKKIIILTVFILSTQFSPALAQTIDIFVNSTPVHSDQRAYLEETSKITYVPLRAIVEELQGKISWDESRQVITVERNGSAAILKVGSDKVVINGEEVTLDGPVKISEETGRSIVSINFFSDVLHCRVKVGAASGIGIFDGQIDPASFGATIEEYKYQKGAFDLSFPHFSGMNNIMAQAKINEDIEAMIAKFIEDNNNTITSTALTKYKVQYLSQERVSFTVTRYTYTGGAHGSSFMEAYTYDLRTGVRYSFSDLFQCDSAARADINKQIMSEIKKREIPTFGPFRGISDSPSFYIGDNGQPVIFFQQYEIGPYSVGILKFPVQAKKHP